MEIDYTPKLTFSDVLLTPQHSDILSREFEVDITSDFLGTPRLPIISANMDYVTDVRMASVMNDLGAVGIISRFADSTKQLVDLSTKLFYPAYISIGIRNIDFELNKVLMFEPLITGVCIDVAHGYHSQVIKMIKQLKDITNLKIIAGNVATAEGYWALADAGADAIKVGIGPGSVCTTRKVTGIGVPQFSAILECAIEAKITNTHLIADGGINSSGDIVKALAAGANSVMLGHLLAGHDECPGDIFPIGDNFVKAYRGQSILGTNKNAPEGIEGFVPYRGPVAKTLERLVAGVKSGFSYVGARNLEELRNKAHFITVTHYAGEENGTRI